MALLLVLMSLLFLAAWMVLGMTAEAVEVPKQLPSGLPWATMLQSAATHDGPGLRYAMNGRLRVGQAVEVLGEMDGWYKCLTWASAEPVWVNGEYLGIGW